VNSEYKFSVIIPVRFGDMDAMGHVNNAKYLTYFEEARLAYYMNLFQYHADDVKKLNFILAEASVKFRSPARAGEKLEALVRVSEFRTRSFRMEYHLLNAETRKRVAEGMTVQVTYDYEKHVTIPVPEEFKKRVLEFEHKS
jgi:acyl-CoA thioester hydrolase